MCIFLFYFDLEAGRGFSLFFLMILLEILISVRSFLDILNDQKPCSPQVKKPPWLPQGTTDNYVSLVSNNVFGYAEIRGKSV